MKTLISIILHFPWVSLAQVIPLAWFLVKKKVEAVGIV